MKELEDLFTVYNAIGNVDIILGTEQIDNLALLDDYLQKALANLENALDILVKIFERKYNIKFWDYAISIPEYHDDFDRFVASFAEDFKIIK